MLSSKHTNQLIFQLTKPGNLETWKPGNLKSLQMFPTKQLTSLQLQRLLKNFVTNLLVIVLISKLSLSWIHVYMIILWTSKIIVNVIMLFSYWLWHCTGKQAFVARWSLVLAAKLGLADLLLVKTEEYELVIFGYVISLFQSFTL